MTRVAVVTCDEMPHLDGDEARLVPALCALGCVVVTPSWRAATFDWSSVDVAVIRTTWDYQVDLGAFLSWAERVDKQTRLVNTLSVVQWNTHKRYLRALHTAGVPVVPTWWVYPGERVDLAAGLGARKWDRFVIKPSVGATASGAMVGAIDEIDVASAHMTALQTEGEVLIQPFLDDVVAFGEWSAVLLGGAYSHGVLKTAAPGDWRVQEEWGGGVQACAAPPGALEVVDRAIAAIPSSVAYGRVDLVRVPGHGWSVIELELVEPALYFRCAPGSEDRLAAALLTQA